MDRQNDVSMKYVVGFAFSPDMENVLLIRKQRPEWQCGFLNGIGGKVEPGELPLEAMTRECAEESGLRIPEKDWTYIVRMDSRKNVICFYYTTAAISTAVQLTDEELVVAKTLHSQTMPVIDNLRWMIPFCIYIHTRNKSIFPLHSILPLHIHE